MYLARHRIKNKINYFIRQSYLDQGVLKSRDLFELGTDPSRYIVYLGGNGYYYDPDIQENLARRGLEVDQNQLDDLFFEFLDPEIQRVINGFDRGRRRAREQLENQHKADATAHLFDKRRYHFLRFGPSAQKNIEHLSMRLFRPLLNKSRDELEQYFITQERLLRHHEKASYVSTIFNLRAFVYDAEAERPIGQQLDGFFMHQLCHLNADIGFWGHVQTAESLHEYLVKYAIIYFDYERPARPAWQAQIEDFINQHRTYRPPPKVQIKIEEAGRFFGMPWRELKRLDRASLSRLYRRKALKYHPDRGGDPDVFRRLTQYYQALLKRRPRK